MAENRENLCYDVIVIGGGPAGLAAALAARQNGAESVLLLERNDDLGGILNQCIHNGFGLHFFKEELTGPEYAERFVKMVEEEDIEILCGAMVLQTGVLSPKENAEIIQNKCDENAGKIQENGNDYPLLVHAIHCRRGYMALRANAVILAMGCRERTRGAIGIPGTRPAGVFTAGAAQLYMNIEGYTVGRRAVILGSGDIGLIMARRLTLEGASVEGVYELMPFSGGLNRNIVQCLEDYDIPLHLSHTITEIRGDERVEAVVVQRVDENRRPVPGTERVIDCDTVLLSVGLIPENELSRNAGVEIDARTGGPVVYENMETSLPGLFACGNVAHVHDLVDFVTAESQRAGAAAGVYCHACRAAAPEAASEENTIQLSNGGGVGYTVPQKIRKNTPKNVDVFFRVNREFGPSRVVVRAGEKEIAAFKREQMAPGEMERITLPVKILEKTENNSLEIAAEPV